MKKMMLIGISILASAAACAAHPGHEARTYGVFWKRPGSAHQEAGAQGEIWRHAFVSIYSWTAAK